MQFLVKTPNGAAAFRERSPRMSLRQRSIFLLCNGQRTVEAVLAATASIDTTQADVDYLVELGFLCAVAPALSTAPLEVSTPSEEVQEATNTVGKSPFFAENWTLF